MLYDIKAHFSNMKLKVKTGTLNICLDENEHAEFKKLSREKQLDWLKKDGMFETRFEPDIEDFGEFDGFEFRETAF